MRAPASPGAVRHLATIATIGNALAGCAAIALVLAGGGGAAVYALVAAALVCDGLDGWLARRFGSVAFGARLDAWADLVSFVALPGALLLAAGLPLAGALFVAAGALRLLRFARAPGASTFRGAPASVACACVVLASRAGVAGAWMGALALVLAALMLSPLRYPMIRGALSRLLWPFVVLIAAHAVALVAFPAARVWTLRSAFAIVAAVAVGSPLVVWLGEQIQPRRGAVGAGADGVDVGR